MDPQQIQSPKQVGEGIAVMQDTVRELTVVSSAVRTPWASSPRTTMCASDPSPTLTRWKIKALILFFSILAVAFRPPRPLAAAPHLHRAVAAHSQQSCCSSSSKASH
jgi:hypothetical protein